MDDNDRILRAQEIFLELIDTPDDQIEHNLKMLCGADLILTDYCRKLIANANRDTDTVGLLYGKNKPTTFDSARVGEKIGTYVIRKKIGQGGMAEVFLANRSDGVHEKPVALKIVHSIKFQDDLNRRFNNERVILANLNHPNISSLLDGGNTSDGMPYFVMEYVDGIRIDEYCRQRNLTVSQILQLFSKVCHAVDFAHKNLVIHRDIKPSNILVDANGEPHLLDFGIAKVLDKNSEDDTVTVFALTANYASPEQLLGKSLTTSSDIYSLGRLLYELLCGALPNNRRSLNALFLNSGNHKDAVTAPSKFIDERLEQSNSTKREYNFLSDRRNHVKGDLDSVLLKSLEVRPEDRYETVKDFSEDLQRYLEKRPVKAKNNTLRYRTIRFVQRHRFPVFISLFTTILFSLSIGFQQHRIIQERDNALIERDKAIETKNFILGLFQSANPQEAMNSNITAKEIVDRGAHKLSSSFETQPFVKAEISHTLGKIYLELSAFDTAEKLLDESLTTFSNNGDFSSITAAEVMVDLGIVYYRTRQFDKGKATLQQALETLENGNTQNLSKAAEALYWLGYIIQSNNNFEEALITQQKSLAYYKQAYDDDHPKVAESLTAIASLSGQLGDEKSYLETNLEALRIRQKHLEENHPQLGQSYFYVGSGYRAVRDFEKSLENLNKAIQIWEQAYPENHIRLFIAYHTLANTQKSLLKFPEALTSLDKAEAILNSLKLNRYSMVSGLRGIIYEDMGDLENALINKEKALQQDIEKYGENSPSTERNYNNVGIIYGKLGQTDKAVEAIEKSLQINRQIYGEVSAKVANNYDSLGEVYLSAELFEQSIEYYEKALSYFLELFGEDHSGVETARKGLDEARSRLGG